MAKSEFTPEEKCLLVKWAIIGVGIIALIISIPMFIMPQYRVWEQGLVGKAELARATQNRQIAIEVAKAKLESANLEAKAEIERAKGVAEANKIIGDSLKGNEAYLRYLWIQGLQEGATPQVVYVPTEAGLPILEAGRTNGKQ